MPKADGNILARYDRVSIERRFFPRVNKNGPVIKPDLGPCWEWTASLDANGYGQLSSGKRPAIPLKAHRISWEIYRGPIPDGMCVLHSCDNPKCANPSHLRLGTQTENMVDKVERGRHYHGERCHLSKISSRTAGLIFAEAHAGRKTHQSIADSFGVSRATVGDIKRGKSWKLATGAKR